jgi:hypothetical protein
LLMRWLSSSVISLYLFFRFPRAAVSWSVNRVLLGDFVSLEIYIYVDRFEMDA